MVINYGWARYVPEEISIYHLDLTDLGKMSKILNVIFNDAAWNLL